MCGFKLRTDVTIKFVSQHNIFFLKDDFLVEVSSCDVEGVD